MNDFLADHRFELILAGFGVLLLLLAGVWVAVVWVRRFRYTRERFAFVALTAYTTMAFSLFAALATKALPWQLVAAVIELAGSERVEIPEPRWVEYGFLILTFFLVHLGIRSLYQSWDGPKSLEQAKREERREPPSLIAEAASEAKWLTKHPWEPRPTVQDKTPDYAFQLASVTDHIAWQDEARELVELATRSFRFSGKNGWHAGARCWVGVDRDTYRPVMLFPRHELPIDLQGDILGPAAKIQEAKSLQGASIWIAVYREVELAGADLPTEVEVRTREQLLDSLADFTDYHEDIRRRIEEEPLPDSEKTLQDVFVEPHVDVDEGSVELREIVEAWVREPGQRQLALLGEYGQGKSSATQMLCYQALRDELDLQGRVPLLIELRGSSPRNMTPLQLLGAWASKYRLDPGALFRLLVAGRLLLIFEGFDEMALAGDVEMRLKHFQTLWQFCYPKAKILITGRPNFFFDRAEMVAALGLREPKADQPYCQDFRLRMFTPEQIALALRPYPDATVEQISELAEANPRFWDIVARPSLLHAVASIWDAEKLAEKAPELTSASVMGLYVRQSYRRQGAKESGSGAIQVAGLNSAERSYFMTGIACHMLAKDLPNQITGRELRALVEDLIEAIPDEVSAGPDVKDGETREPLRKRLELAESLKLEEIHTDIRASGLLVDDPTSTGSFRFGHKSFMEYLCAEALAAQVKGTQLPMDMSLIAVTGLKLNSLIRKAEIVEFLLELLGLMSKAGRETNAAERASWRALYRALVSLPEMLAPLALVLLKAFDILAIPTELRVVSASHASLATRKTRRLPFGLTINAFPKYSSLLDALSQTTTKHIRIASAVLDQLSLLFLLVFLVLAYGAANEGSMSLLLILLSSLVGALTILIFVLHHVIPDTLQRFILLLSVARVHPSPPLMALGMKNLARTFSTFDLEAPQPDPPGNGRR